MKKIISVLLTLVLLVSLSIPAFAAETPDELPIIYMSGRGCELIRPDGVWVWEPEGSAIDNLKDNLKDLLKDYVSGAFKHNFDAFNDRLYNCVAPVYTDAALGRNGMPTDGSGVPDYINWRLGLDKITTTLATSYGRVPVFRWHYDWRLSPITLADELHELVDAVLAETGAPQVNIISRCEGSTITYTYLYKYSTENKVHACVMNSDITEGTDFLTALFTGDIQVDPAALTNFVRFFADAMDITIKNEETTAFLLDLISFMQATGSLRVLTKLVEGIVKSVKNDLFPRLLQSSFATYPAYWSMLTADKYEQAKAFVFGGDTAEWSELIALTDEFYEMQKDARTFLQKVSKTVRICTIAKYGLPALPLSARAREEADIYLAVSLASHGATAANYDGMLPNHYIKAQTDNGLGKYISPDRKIDASTCALPETTWFVKGMAHRCFAACVEDLSVAFVRSDDMTVDTDEAFPQFMQFHATNDSLNDAEGYLTAVENVDAPSALQENRFVHAVTNPFVQFAALTRSFWRMLLSLNK